MTWRYLPSEKKHRTGYLLVCNTIGKTNAERSKLTEPLRSSLSAPQASSATQTQRPPPCPKRRSLAADCPFCPGKAVRVARCTKKSNLFLRQRQASHSANHKEKKELGLGLLQQSVCRIRWMTSIVQRFGRWGMLGNLGHPANCTRDCNRTQ